MHLMHVFRYMHRSAVSISCFARGCDVESIYDAVCRTKASCSCVSPVGRSSGWLLWCFHHMPCFSDWLYEVLNWCFSFFKASLLIATSACLCPACVVLELQRTLSFTPKVFISDGLNLFWWFSGIIAWTGIYFRVRSQSYVNILASAGFLWVRAHQAIKRDWSI